MRTNLANGPMPRSCDIHHNKTKDLQPRKGHLLPPMFGPPTLSPPDPHTNPDLTVPPGVYKWVGVSSIPSETPHSCRCLASTLDLIPGTWKWRSRPFSGEDGVPSLTVTCKRIKNYEWEKILDFILNRMQANRLRKSSPSSKTVSRIKMWFSF